MSQLYKTINNNMDIIGKDDVYQAERILDTKRVKVSGNKLTILELLEQFS